jgi:hypothetical protein
MNLAQVIREEMTYQQNPGAVALAFWKAALMKPKTLKHTKQ